MYKPSRRDHARGGVQNRQKEEKSRKKRTPEEWRSLLVQKLLAAKTEDDLEEANDLADELVTAGIVTQEEVDALWDDLAPNLYE